MTSILCLRPAVTVGPWPHAPFLPHFCQAAYAMHKLQLHFAHAVRSPSSGLSIRQAETQSPPALAAAHCAQLPVQVPSPKTTTTLQLPVHTALCRDEMQPILNKCRGCGQVLQYATASSNSRHLLASMLTPGMPQVAGCSAACG